MSCLLKHSNNSIWFVASQHCPTNKLTNISKANMVSVNKMVIPRTHWIHWHESPPEIHKHMHVCFHRSHNLTFTDAQKAFHDLLDSVSIRMGL